MNRRRRVIPVVYYSLRNYTSRKGRNYAPRRRQIDVPSQQSAADAQNENMSVDQAAEQNHQLAMQEPPELQLVQFQIQEPRHIEEAPMMVQQPLQRLPDIPENGNLFFAEPTVYNHAEPVRADLAILPLQPAQIFEEIPTRQISVAAKNEKSAEENRDIESAQIALSLAKLEKKVERYEKTIQCLQSRIGIEDLTVAKMNEYGEMLLSSCEELSDDSGDSSDDEASVNHENDENLAPNIVHRKQTDMMFSFSHEFVLNVRNSHFIFMPTFIYVCDHRKKNHGSIKMSKLNCRNLQWLC